VVFISFIGPHYPMIAPPEFYNLYKPEDMPLPKAKPDRPGKLRDWWDAFENCYIIDRFFEDDHQRQVAIAGYFGLISFIDNHVGRIMQVMEETGLMDNTRLAFTSDHGENLGARGLWGKSNIYKESVGVPMIISGADIPQGKVVETPVSLIDFYPTILQNLGIAPKDQDMSRPGQSLVDIAQADDDPDRVVFSEYHATASRSGIFMLRNGHYKYVHYVNHGAELYDMAADPEELNNLSSEPEYQSIIGDFEKQLREMLDPEAVDAHAKKDQEKAIAQWGGPEAILNREVPIGTPAPEV
jgi:choline-sulfatase